MSNTGTVIVSLVVGAVVGYGVARLTAPQPPPTCGSHLIVVDPNSVSTDLGEYHVCKSKYHRIRWESSNGANITVTWTMIQNPPTAPYPYTLNCSNFVKNYCDSGPLLQTAVINSKAYYEVKIQGSTKVFNGRIIIDP